MPLPRRWRTSPGASDVSTVAVSAVLSASAGNRTGVSDATRQRIQDAARGMNYTPNGIAKMFRRNSTDIIGLYLGDWLLNTHDLFLAEIVSGLQIGCKEYGKDLLIHSKFRDHPVEDVYLELINRKIDGLIMFAQEGDALATRLASSSLPVVALADAVSSLPSVVTDDRGGSWMIAEYLAAQGHERVLYRRRPSVQTSANRRHEAFLAAAVHVGLTVVEDAARAAGFDLPLSDAEQAILGQAPAQRPTAIVCGNDLLAYATVESCQERNFRVPEDFAVVGIRRHRDAGAARRAADDDPGALGEGRADGPRPGRETPGGQAEFPTRPCSRWSWSSATPPEGVYFFHAGS